MTNLDALQAAAKAATPGPWSATLKRGKRDGYIRSPLRTVADVRYRNGEADAAFIAAANPQTVLAMISELRRLREMLRELTDWLRPYGVGKIQDSENRGLLGGPTAVKAWEQARAALSATEAKEDWHAEGGYDPGSQP
jgi:hypothetical protein